MALPDGMRPADRWLAKNAGSAVVACRAFRGCELHIRHVMRRLSVRSTASPDQCIPCPLFSRFPPGQQCCPQSGRKTPHTDQYMKTFPPAARNGMLGRQPVYATSALVWRASQECIAWGKDDGWILDISTRWCGRCRLLVHGGVCWRCWRPSRWRASCSFVRLSRTRRVRGAAGGGSSGTSMVARGGESTNTRSRRAQHAHRIRWHRAAPTCVDQ